MYSIQHLSYNIQHNVFVIVIDVPAPSTDALAQSIDSPVESIGVSLQSIVAPDQSIGVSLPSSDVPAKVIGVSEQDIGFNVTAIGVSTQYVLDPDSKCLFRTSGMHFTDSYTLNPESDIVSPASSTGNMDSGYVLPG